MYGVTKMSEEFESDITDEQFIEQLKDYLEEHFFEQIIDLMPSSTYIQSLESEEMHNFFMKRADGFISLLRTAIIDIIAENNSTMSKERIKKEFANLNIKLSTESNRTLSNTSAESVNSPIVFNCVITGLNSREVYIYRAHFRCPMGHPEGEMNVDCNNKRELPNMLACPDCGEKLQVVPDKSLYKYLQRATLQEPPEESKEGNPLEFDAILSDLQVGDATVGNRKEIIGILRPLVDKKSLMDNKHKLVIDCKSVNDLEGHNELEFNDDELEKIKLEAQSQNFFTNVAKSFSPDVFADDLLMDVKKTIMLCLVGGMKVGNKRGDINILLLGDPSMAKSTLLKFASKVIRKSIYTSGRGASAAGITIGIVKRPDGTSIAQAGVLPLCDLGFAFIDELDKMNPNDRSGLHEAMEQQSVSISKAGHSMTLPARTAIIAAANPKGGKWIEEASVVDNINLLPTLLSRFDIKWCIKDIISRGSDELKADHILGTFGEETDPQYSIEDLTKLLNYVRKLKPVMTREAMVFLKEFFIMIRQKSIQDEQAIIDFRGFEGLIRLSYAHAKLHFKDKVEISDASAAVSLYESALSSFGFNLKTGNVQNKTFEQSDRDNQIELWWKVWRKVQDDNTKTVNERDFFDELLQYDKIWSEHKAEQFWNKLRNDGKILMTRFGYKRVD
jgi:replicative DNA helicase Mcm